MPEEADERIPLEFMEDHEAISLTWQRQWVRTAFAEMIEEQAAYDGDFDHYPFNLEASALLKTN